MELIRQMGWEFIVVWKDACLTTVWEQLAEMEYEGKTKTIEKEDILNGSTLRKRSYAYSAEKLVYRKPGDYEVELYSVEMSTETIDDLTKQLSDEHRFAFLTSFLLSEKNVESIVQTGRMRWKIENEGFNDQKNNGMELYHKYVRYNQTGMCNYYLCMQLASMLKQLIELCQNKFTNGKFTWKSMWRYAWAYLFALPLERLFSFIEIKT